MTLSAPVSMSVIGDAQQVRHLRAGGKSWAVWLINDDGTGQRWVVRERTGVISLVATLRTDGTDFSERIVPLPPMKVVNFHVLETTVANEVIFLFSDGKKVKQFTWDVVTNVVTSAVTDVADGDIPSQFSTGSLIRQFYVRARKVLTHTVGSPSENVIIDPSVAETYDLDVVRKAVSSLARYAGTQAINRDLALPFLPEASSVFCYDMATALVSVTEALPPGVVSYYTFDAANFSGSTMLDQVGANNATLVGTAPTSVAGKVGEARQFATGTGNGHYSLGNPSNLRITGNLSLAFWFKMTAFNNYHHPIHKAYGGEYTSIIYDNGSGYFYYGTAGSNTAPYAWLYFPPGTVPFNVWTHMAFVRDLTNRTMTLYINGKPFIQVAAPFAAAVADVSNSFLIGNAVNWTNTLMAGQLDEMLIANQSWSAQSVAALYAKGQAGIKANVSGAGSARRLIDSSANARHAVLSEPAIVTPGGLSVAQNMQTGLAAAQTTGYVIGSALTVEARLVPRWATAGERSIFGNRAFGYTTSSYLQGLIEVAFTSDGLVIFRYETATLTVELRQTGGSRLRFNELNYIAVTHTFGAGGASTIVVNGDQVPTAWIGGAGNESPTLLASAPAIIINPGDELLGLRVSNVAKSLATIRNYLRGRS